MQELTPVDEFTDPVEGVQDGDRPTEANLNAAPQALLNRTEWLGNRVGWLAQGTFGTDTGMGTGDYFSIASVSDLTSKGFVEVSPDKVKVPAPGVYEVEFYIQVVSSSTADNPLVAFAIYKESTGQATFQARRGDTDAASSIQVRGRFFVTITDEDTERIRFRIATAAGTISVETGSRWMIKRVG